MQEQSPTNKRYELATNESARDRLDQFRDEVKRFQQEHPEMLGATVYGSMIKGDQAKETSDVDAFLYIDAETLPEEERVKDSETIKNDYRSEFLKEMNIPEEDQSKYYGDLRTQLLSDEIISNDINSKIEYESQKESYKKMMEEKYTYETPEDEKERLLAMEPQFKGIDFGIKGMFHARVGSGIEKYRHVFLEKVNTLSDKKVASEIWEDVYSHLKTMEQRSDPNKTIDIPPTLDDAIRIYHPKLSREISKKKEDEEILRLKEEITKTLSA